MAKIYHFESAIQKDINDFFDQLSDTFSWADEVLFVSHSREGIIQIGILGNDIELTQDSPHMIGILEKAKLSIILDELE